MEQEATRDALGRFKPGVSGNPAGRTPGCGLKHEILQRLEKDGEDGKQNVAAIAETLIELARAGDTRAIEMLLKRAWPERLEIDPIKPPVLKIIDLSDDARTASQPPAFRDPRQEAPTTAKRATPLIRRPEDPSAAIQASALEGDD